MKSNSDIPEPQASPEPEDLRGACARIARRSARPVQAGMARADEWLLEFEPAEKPGIEPLMGWQSSGDANQQVRMTFSSLEAALTYCRREGLGCDIVPDPPNRRRPRSYADNFTPFDGKPKPIYPH